MAGAGVGVGMLRARRRDVSVKLNRKLDRKSSRGMIYENEELRLRTININAEVEQGQNDIKKLRRENEQLRREIWSLRDEYDKLEEILKRQKSREESEEYEDRSDEDDDLRSEYSFEEDEEPDQDDQESNKELSKSEQLENAENQKISSEKMAGNGVHRLHVDFDDLSVVDEEEEPKRDKDKKEFSEDDLQAKENRSPLSILKSTRQLHENIPFYPATYQTPTSLTSPTYYTECPFKFPSTMNLMMPSESSGMGPSPCPRLNADSLVPMSRLTAPNIDSVSDQILHAPPVGWQSNILMPQEQSDTFGATVVDGSTGIHNYGGIQHDQAKLQSLESMSAGLSTLPGFLPKRNIGLKLSANPFNATGFANAHLNTEKAAVENGWCANSDSMNLRGAKETSSSDVTKKETKESAVLSVTEKPKHFFAPLSSKLKKPAEEPSPTISHFGTGNSSSSEKTGSTVVSKNQYTTQKGSADVYVSGAIPCENGFHKTMSEQQRTYLSTDNLLITGEKCTPSNQLTKSMSCQDLHRESQSASSISHADGRQQMMTKSDNTLDNISETKPYKSHLSVTLKTPKTKQAVSPDTPEIPELPSIDYRLFKNPFLRTFDPPSNYMDQANVTRPLSVQVNDENPCYYSSQPEVSGFNRGIPFDRYRSNQTDQNRLLIPSNQMINGKLVSPTGKHQIQVTSFEKPSPHTLIGPSQYDLSTLRRLNSNPYMQTQNLYQNMPFLQRGGLYPQRGMMYYENLALKVPAQTQTSIDGDSHVEDEHTLEETALTTPSGQHRRRPTKKEKGGTVKETKPLSPANQRRLKKQSSYTSSEMTEPIAKTIRKKHRRLSIATTTTSDCQEDKNESRSSSSGQDSPKKEQVRRVSLYFNAKKRPSLTSVKTSRSNSLDVNREKDAMTMNSERERTNSMSSREIDSIKARKASTSSEKVPWCACWGNGCV